MRPLLSLVAESPLSPNGGEELEQPLSRLVTSSFTDESCLY